MNAFEIWSLYLFEGSLQATVTGVLLIGLAATTRRHSVLLAHGFLGIAILKFALPPVFALPTGFFSANVVRFDLPGRAHEMTFWMTTLLAVHVSGMLVVGVRRAAELVRLRRITRQTIHPSLATVATYRNLTSHLGLSKPPDLRVSDEVTVPCTLGVRRAVILLPAQLEDRLTNEELRAVLLHELNHIRFHDNLWNTVTALMSIVWWFHPVFRVADSLARALREERCDEAVVIDGSFEPRDYARAIVRVAEIQAGRTSLFAPGIADSAHPLRGRIAKIRAMAPSPQSRFPGMRLVALLALSVVFLPGIEFRSLEAPDKTIYVHGSDSNHHQHNH